ncbi:MAG: AAA family ATPase [Methylophaga sp.]|nr:AAA family ATPase [Methylophaga sp.]
MLNTKQQEAVEEVFQFLMTDTKEFNISGFPGTGKTYLMKFITDTLMKRYKDACFMYDMPCVPYEIQLCATTNKAAEVLSKVTSKVATTIHSFLGLQVKNDFSAGKSYLKKTQKWKIHSNLILFIDEASMADTELHNIILESLDNTCKIIYIGDADQLAPISDTNSPVYNSNIPTIYLDQSMRNAEKPALINICSQLRETVQTGIFKPIVAVPGVIDYLDDSQLQHLLQTQYRNLSVNSRILCFTNDRVNQYNEYIRNLRQLPKRLIVGEHLINNSAIAMGRIHMHPEQRVEVISVEPSTSVIDLDSNDSGITLHVYNLTVLTDYEEEIELKIPVDMSSFNKLIKYFGKKKDWSNYFYLKNNFADLRPKDAATVHKAQGSTYTSVILDLGNIGECYEADTVARMLYVGVSRPSERIYLYGELPWKYTS